MYFNELYQTSEKKTITGNTIEMLHNYSITYFKNIWIVNYSLLFTCLLAIFNFKKLKNRTFGFVNFGLLLITIVLFLSGGSYMLSNLRDWFLKNADASFMCINIRYISYIFVGLAVYMCYLYTKKDFMEYKRTPFFDFILHTTIVWVASSELINCMQIAQVEQSYKLGLSILWGVYALLLIILGIHKKKKYLRIAAITLFTVTLLKLFFYDIAALSTIAKTIVFVSLGILLLIISFLYNKYKNIIADEEAN